MTKLSLIKRVINPTKKGAKKSLLVRIFNIFLCFVNYLCILLSPCLRKKRDGIKSDGDLERDDDSSSLSDRQEKGRSKTKKKFDARQFFSRNAKKNDEIDVSIFGIIIFHTCSIGWACSPSHE
jgi:hypothetical protein